MFNFNFNFKILIVYSIVIGMYEIDIDLMICIVEINDINKLLWIEREKKREKKRVDKRYWLSLFYVDRCGFWVYINYNVMKLNYVVYDGYVFSIIF